MNEKIWIANTKLSDAKEARDKQIMPILKIFGIDHCSILSVESEGKFVLIEYGGYCRGSDWTNHITLPINIFTAKDSVRAAQQYLEETTQVKKLNQRQEKLNQLETLKKELGL